MSPLFASGVNENVSVRNVKNAVASLGVPLKRDVVTPSIWLRYPITCPVPVLGLSSALDT